MSYHIVEYRLAIHIDGAKGRGETAAKDAANKAKDILEKETGIRLSNWHARVFEFGDDSDIVGPEEGYFFSPSGEKARAQDQNIKED